MRLLGLQVCALVCSLLALVVALDCPATITKTHITTKKITKGAGRLTNENSASFRSATGPTVNDDDLDIDVFSSDNQKEKSEESGQCPGQVTTTKTVVVKQIAGQDSGKKLDSAPDARLKRWADPPPPTTAGPTTGSGTAPTSVSTDYTPSCKPPCVFTPSPVPLKETATLHSTNVTTAFCSIVQGNTYKWPLYYTVGDVAVSSLGMAPVHVPPTATKGQTLQARPTVAPSPTCSVEIPDDTFICLPPNAPISPKGKCGPKVDGPSFCPILECCANGECGNDQQHCKRTLGCQEEFGLCYIRWDDAIHDRFPADPDPDPEPAAPNEQKMINVSCPNFVGSDMQGLEELAGFAAGTCGLGAEVLGRWRFARGVRRYGLWRAW